MRHPTQLHAYFEGNIVGDGENLVCQCHQPVCQDQLVVLQIYISYQ